MKKKKSPEVLRYYMHDGPKSFRFELAGAITSESARRLEQDWRTASSVTDGKALVVDLSFVTEVDEAGQELMRAWQRMGAEFVAKSATGRALVEAITGSPMPVREPDHNSDRRSYRPWMSLRTAASLIGLLLLMLPAPVMAATLATESPTMAFGRYVALVETNAPFSESGNVAVDVEAWLPSMDKHGHLVAIRHSSPSAPGGEYEVVRIEGDSTVKQQVIARYLSAQSEAEALPASSVAVTPVNYNFRYIGSIQTAAQTTVQTPAGGTPSSLVYVFDITPKKKRDGLIQGQLYIDAQTGIAVHQTGYVVKKPSVFVRRIAITRDLEVADGMPSSRKTRVEIDTRIVGRAELTITERPLPVGEEMIAERGKP